MFKIHIHGALVFVTSSMQNGLYLPPNALINLIILSCLGRAQTLYKVRIVALSVSTTHMHLILVIEDPEMLKEFIRHFKAEVSHAINNVLGVPNRNLWNEGYDSPMIIDTERAIQAIAYTYANPVKDNLVAHVDQYPGVNTFEYAHLMKDIQIEGIWVPRSGYREVPEQRRNPEGYKVVVESLKNAHQSNYQVLTISPHAWLDALGVELPEERHELQRQVIDRVRKIEKEAQEKRTKDGKSVLGSRLLIATPIGAHYIPKRRGRRTYVLGSIPKTRKKIISKLKFIFQEARRIRNLQRSGHVDLPYPAGLYPPALTKLIQPLCLLDMVAAVA
jgi:REP element-mobilizing transposase RayT